MNLKIVLCLFALSIYHAKAIIDITPTAQALLQLCLILGKPISEITSLIAALGPAIGISNSPDDVLFYFYP